MGAQGGRLACWEGGVTAFPGCFLRAGHRMLGNNLVSLARKKNKLDAPTIQMQTLYKCHPQAGTFGGSWAHEVLTLP